MDKDHLIEEHVDTQEEVRVVVVDKAGKVRGRTRAPYRQQRPRYISRKEGSRLLDQQARACLGMSGAEFRRKYRSGEFRDSDNRHVKRLAFLLPLGEEQ